MEPQDAARSVIAEVETLTGCPVQVVQDAAIRTMAVLDVARGPLRLHRIRIHPNFQDQIDYLTCFECGFIMRKFATPPERRFDFASNAKGRREIEKLVQDHHADKRLPSDVLRGLCDQLYDGLMMQLISIATSMRVDAWIAETYPRLEGQQKVMVARQLQDSLNSMKPEAKKVAPMQVVKPSLTINAAYTLFWSRRWKDPLLSLPYRSANLGVQGGRLLELFDTISSDPEQDKALVDAWAKELGVDHLFRWIPYRLDET